MMTLYRITYNDFFPSSVKISPIIRGFGYIFQRFPQLSFSCLAMSLSFFFLLRSQISIKHSEYLIRKTNSVFVDVKKNQWRIFSWDVKSKLAAELCDFCSFMISRLCTKKKRAKIPEDWPWFGKFFEYTKYYAYRVILWKFDTRLYLIYTLSLITLGFLVWFMLEEQWEKRTSFCCHAQ